MTSPLHPRESGSIARVPHIERDGRFWQVVFPAAPDEGMDLCTGPCFTYWGARLSRWFSIWLEGPTTEGENSEDACPICGSDLRDGPHAHGGVWWRHVAPPVTRPDGPPREPTTP